MIKSLMKNFHLPTDTLRITLIPFSPRLNDQSIKEIRLRIARILNWAESEILISLALLSRFKFGALPRIYDLLSRNDLPTAFLQWPSIQLNTHITRNRANYRIKLMVSFYFFPHTAQPIQIQSFS